MSNPADVVKALEAKMKIALQTLPRVIGNEAVNFSKERFRNQNWWDKAAVPWMKRKAGSKRNKGRAILRDKGALARSPRVVSATPRLVVLGSSLPYAKANNDGFNGTVRVKAHTRSRFSKQRVGSGKFTAAGKERMKTVSTITGTIRVRSHSKKMNLPQRRFMGNSAQLTSRLKRVAAIHILRTIK